MGLGEGEDGLGDVGRRLVAAGREAGPVVEVDDADSAVRIHDAVTTIDDNIQLLGSLGADAFQLLQVDIDTLGVAVDLFPTVLVMPR